MAQAMAKAAKSVDTVKEKREKTNTSLEDLLATKLVLRITNHWWIQVGGDVEHTITKTILRTHVVNSIQSECLQGITRSVNHKRRFSKGSTNIWMENMTKKEIFLMSKWKTKKRNLKLNLMKLSKYSSKSLFKSLRIMWTPWKGKER
jgi:hypothetical protein